MATINLRTWTVDEYHQMLRAGILATGDRVELLSGQIVRASPQEPPHAATTRRASRFLDRLLANRADVRAQLPITLPPDSEPEPDIAVVRLDSKEYADRHPSAAEIFWVVEVSDTTLRSDRTQKAGIYATAGIPEYWILAVKSRRAYVLRDPKDGSYGVETILTANDTIRPLAFADLEISFADLFLPE